MAGILGENKCIPVIASFDTKGHICPLYVRLNGQKCKVESYWLKPSYYQSTIFCCKVIDGSYEKIIDITYHHGSQTWSIPYHPTQVQ